MADLEEQIAQITNPDEFVKLCNSLLTEEHGTDFQVIDGTRGDGADAPAPRFQISHRITDDAQATLRLSRAPLPGMATARSA